MKSKTPADWRKVREAYCNTAMPVRDICARFSVSETSVYRHIKLENWPRRSETRRSGAANKTKPDKMTSEAADMVSRLSGVFLKQLREAEAAANAPGASAAERERAGRALSVLWKNYEKLKEHEEMQTVDDSKTDTGKPAGWQSGEEERLRKEIYKRLTRMLQKRRTERAAKKTKPE